MTSAPANTARPKLDSHQWATLIRMLALLFILAQVAISADGSLQIVATFFCLLACAPIFNTFIANREETNNRSRSLATTLSLIAIAWYISPNYYDRQLISDPIPGGPQVFIDAISFGVLAFCLLDEAAGGILNKFERRFQKWAFLVLVLSGIYAAVVQFNDAKFSIERNVRSIQALQAADIDTITVPELHAVLMLIDRGYISGQKANEIIKRTDALIQQPLFDYAIEIHPLKSPFLKALQEQRNKMDLFTFQKLPTPTMTLTSSTN